MLPTTTVFIWGHLKALKVCLEVVQIPLKRSCMWKAIQSVNLLLVDMVHGFLGVCCHELKTSALGYEGLKYVYIALLSQHISCFFPLLHLSQLYTVFWS